MDFKPFSKQDRVFVPGHQGMLGSAICRRLKKNSYSSILTATREQCDLTNAEQTRSLFEEMQPTAVIVAAAKVGGINANNKYRSEFIFENIRIACNVIESAHKCGVKKLIFLSSSCVYPRECPQPISENDLLIGELEATNRAYALAKLAGMEMVNSVNAQYGRSYYSVLPCNLYGPDDRFDPNDSHVIPGILRKIISAKKAGQSEVLIWGTGTPKREFMHVDDCADGIIYLAENLSAGILQSLANDSQQFFHFNHGSGEELSIKGLAEKLAKLCDYKGDVKFDTTQPDGTQRKLLDSSRLRQVGWQPKIKLDDGLSDLMTWIEKENFDWT